MTARVLVLTLLVVVAVPVALAAQGYRVRLDTRAQAVSYRGLALDSVLASDTVSGPGGGAATPDGYAVRCAGADPHCTYFRPGPVRRAAPLTAVAGLAVWGFGVRGLSAHSTARVGLDLGAADVWPGTTPAMQLLDGYVQYAGQRVTARLGRQVSATRFGTTGFDGAQLALRDADLGIEVGGFAGWGLDRGTALPVTSPALNPLDDFQPRRRLLVAGVGAGRTGPHVNARVDYLREVDPRSDYFVSERVGLAAVVRPAAGWSVSGGADYDLAAGWWGSADATLAYATSTASAAAGVRRYRPHFDLWTIWGAFSPVPYRSVHGRLAVRVRSGVELRARGERYRFDAAEAQTPLVRAERDGWRWDVGTSVVPQQRWTIDAGYHAEFGPGAGSAGVGGSVTYAPTTAFRASVHAASLDRPLEFRFSDAAVRLYGIDARWGIGSDVLVSVGATRYLESRDRPDAAAFDWSQWRVVAGIVMEFGSEREARALAVIRRLPGGRAAR